MGEYAEMMLDGTCCEACGVYLDQEPQGFPGYCSEQCAVDRGMAQVTMTRKERHAAKKPLTDAQRARRKRKTKAKNARRKMATLASRQEPTS